MSQKFFLLFLRGFAFGVVLSILGCSDKNPEAITIPFFGETGNLADGQTLSGKNIKYSRYTITYDNNQDGIVNKGETVYLKLYLKNTGTSLANYVSATITTDNPYVSSLIPTIAMSYGTITAGGETYAQYSTDPSFNYYSCRFTVSSTTPSGTMLTFNLNIADGQNNTWTSSFSIPVQATGANIQYSRHTVTYDDTRDGIINKGETIYLRLYLRNTGTSWANDVNATITTSSNYVSSLIPVIAMSYGTMTTSGETYAQYSTDPSFNYYSCRFTVSNTTPPGTTLTFNLSITDAQSNTWTSSFSITVQATGANVQYSRYIVTYDDNRDGIINRGETVYLKLYLKNTGTSQANNVTSTITTSSPYVLSLVPIIALNYGTITGGSETYAQYSTDPSFNYYSCRFTVSNTTPPGTTLTFNLNIADGQNNTWTSSFSTLIQ